jgi:riboflavin kinase / FMN adenylyltransferase
LAQFISSIVEVKCPESWRQRGTWLSIGSFDGVHRGHQALIHNLVSGSHAENKPAILVTFFPHPASVLRNQHGPYYLTTLDERENLTNQFGVDEVITLSFSREIASISAFDFMSLLKEKLNLQCLLVGYNFALGRGRQGDLASLEQIGKQIGYHLQIIPPFEIGKVIISSSQIRTWLAEGDVGKAAEGLGRPYSMSGKVIHGDGRGHLLGFPTANLEIWPEKAVPSTGVYACWTWLGDRRWPAVVNIGYRPTFETHPVIPRLEAHLLDFQGDLYGKNLSLDFVAFIRGEQPFKSPELLKKQVELDKQHAQILLDTAGLNFAERKLHHEN